MADEPKYAWTTSNYIGVPLAVIAGALWWTFQRGGEFEQLRSVNSDLQRRVSVLEDTTKQGRLWERLAAHDKDFAEIRKDIAVQQALSTCTGLQVERKHK